MYAKTDFDEIKMTNGGGKLQALRCMLYAITFVEDREEEAARCML
jgi:hypothetical protein